MLEASKPLVPTECPQFVARSVEGKRNKAKKKKKARNAAKSRACRVDVMKKQQYKNDLVSADTAHLEVQVESQHENLRINTEV